jgi:hypothetical protein
MTFELGKKTSSSAKWLAHLTPNSSLLLELTCSSTEIGKHDKNVEFWSMFVIKPAHDAVIFELKPVSNALGNGEADSVPTATGAVFVEEEEGDFVTVTVGVATAALVVDDTGREGAF